MTISFTNIPTHNTLHSLSTQTFTTHSQHSVYRFGCKIGHLKIHYLVKYARNALWESICALDLHIIHAKARVSFRVCMSVFFATNCPCSTSNMKVRPQMCVCTITTRTVLQCFTVVAVVLRLGPRMLDNMPFLANRLSRKHFLLKYLWLSRSAIMWLEHIEHPR